GGLGLVRRINMGPYTFFCSGCIYLAVIRYKRRLVLSLLLLATCFIMLSGSKSALLPLIFGQAFVLAHPGLKRDLALTARVKKYTLYTFFAGVAVALVVLIRDQGDIGSGLLGFGKRILLTGDVVMFYFPKREHMIAITNR